MRTWGVVHVVLDPRIDRRQEAGKGAPRVSLTLKFTEVSIEDILKHRLSGSAAPRN